nr:hypothetical protein BaRGS_018401 [Batillaria attramentaria]
MKQYWLLTSDERATLTQLTSAYQDTMMKLTDRDPDKRLSLGSSGGMTLEDFFYVVEQVLHLCVRFAKALPDFWQLKQPDQIAILKTSSMQCDGIALSAMCVPERGVWQTPFGDLGMNHMPAALNTARDRELMAEMLSFSRQLKSVAKSDITIYGLLHCIALFDPSEATLDDKQLVNTLKDKYLILLKHYIESQFSYQHADRRGQPGSLCEFGKINSVVVLELVAYYTVKLSSKLKPKS